VKQIGVIGAGDLNDARIKKVDNDGAFVGFAILILRRRIKSREVPARRVFYFVTQNFMRLSLVSGVSLS
jgi:hypothetical protein